MRHPVRGFLGAAAALFALAGPLAEAPAPAQAVPTGITSVEEDWELVIGSPSYVEAGPQITTTMSPVGDNTSLFFAFNVNYRDDPFRQGGLQVRCWRNEREVATPDTQKSAPMIWPGETVRWTQRLTIGGGVLSYNITNGSSWTWGGFGQGDNLQVACYSSLNSLDAYSPATSVAGSGAGWQANRVSRMRLLQVRYYKQGSLVATDASPRDVALAQ